MATIKGGDKAEAALKEIAELLGNGSTLKVGFLEGATYPDGTSVPMVAAFNEFGTSRAPPRPFFRNMIKDKSPEWPKAIASLLKTHDNDVAAVLPIVGEAIKGQLQQSIRDLVSPPLAESTIKKKGFAKPLIDTSVMINSVGYEVET